MTALAPPQPGGLFLPEQLVLPDDTHLPDSDGTFVKNDQEHPQSMLLTDSILPVLQRLYPENRFCIGQDMGIYWRLAQPPEPLYAGAVAPDWFVVPEVPRALPGGRLRRSYVLWQEWVAPLLVTEFVSGNGAEERDRTRGTGKFWVYEKAIRVPYYAIYEVDPGRVEVHALVAGNYERLLPNARGRFEITPLGLELGIWQGRYQELELPWLRWWDLEGNLLPTSEERAGQEHQKAEEERRRAEQERQRAEQERQRAEQERQRAERLAAQLRALGIEPEA